ncbi:hypothetical protein OUZ56_011319 [Daphnia magna]|uniref:Uncharacterized protein n=1 Tax=Daphnia magna TaxID=35525 RepID=A0ABQ9YZV0_9CRUS|nr:hypothetical protein OUZ56_011319 [Daphnia magna]
MSSTWGDLSCWGIVSRIWWDDEANAVSRNPPASRVLGLDHGRGRTYSAKNQRRELKSSYGFAASKRSKDEALQRLILLLNSYTVVECFKVCGERETMLSCTKEDTY